MPIEDLGPATGIQDLGPATGIQDLGESKEPSFGRKALNVLGRAGQVLGSPIEAVKGGFSERLKRARIQAGPGASIPEIAMTGLVGPEVAAAGQYALTATPPHEIARRYKSGVHEGLKARAAPFVSTAKALGVDIGVPEQQLQDERLARQLAKAGVPGLVAGGMELGLDLMPIGPPAGTLKSLIGKRRIAPRISAVEAEKSLLGGARAGLREASDIEMELQRGAGIEPPPPDITEAFAREQAIAERDAMERALAGEQGSIAPAIAEEERLALASQFKPPWAGTRALAIRPESEATRAIGRTEEAVREMVNQRLALRMAAERESARQSLEATRRGATILGEPPPKVPDVLSEMQDVQALSPQQIELRRAASAARQPKPVGVFPGERIEPPPPEPPPQAASTSPEQAQIVELREQNAKQRMANEILRQQRESARLAAEADALRAPPKPRRIKPTEPPVSAVATMQAEPPATAQVAPAGLRLEPPPPAVEVAQPRRPVQRLTDFERRVAETELIGPQEVRPTIQQEAVEAAKAQGKLAGRAPKMRGENLVADPGSNFINEHAKLLKEGKTAEEATHILTKQIEEAGNAGKWAKMVAKAKKDLRSAPKLPAGVDPIMVKNFLIVMADGGLTRAQAVERLVKEAGPEARVWIESIADEATRYNPTGAIGAVASEKKGILSLPGRGMEKAARAFEVGSGAETKLVRSPEGRALNRTVFEPLNKIINDRTNTLLNRVDAVWNRLSSEDKKWVNNGGVDDLISSGSGKAPSPIAESFVKVWRSVTGDLGPEAAEHLGIKLRGDFSVSKGYVPEVFDALRTRQGEVWDAIKAHVGDADLDALVSKINQHKAEIANRRLPAEFRRILDLPREIPLKSGKSLTTYRSGIDEMRKYATSMVQRIELAKVAKRYGIDITRPDAATLLKERLIKDFNLNTADVQDAAHDFLKDYLGLPEGSEAVTRAMGGKVARTAISLAKASAIPRMLWRMGPRNIVTSNAPLFGKAYQYGGITEAARNPFSFVRSVGRQMMPKRMRVNLEPWYDNMTNIFANESEVIRMAEDARILPTREQMAVELYGGALDSAKIDKFTRLATRVEGMGWANRPASEASIKLAYRLIRKAGKDRNLLGRLAKDFSFPDDMVNRIANGMATESDITHFMKKFANQVNPHNPGAGQMSRWMKDPLAGQSMRFMTYNIAMGRAIASGIREARNMRPDRLVALVGALYGSEVAWDQIKSLGDNDIAESLQNAVMGTPTGVVGDAIGDILGRGRIDMTPPEYSQISEDINDLEEAVFE